MSDEEYTGEGWQPSGTTLIILLVLGVVLAWASNLVYQACGYFKDGAFALVSDTQGVIDQFLALMFTQPFSLDFTMTGMCVSLVFLIAPFVVALLVKGQNKRHYMYNKEHGSSRLGTLKEAVSFSDPEDEYNNIILSKTNRMVLSPKKFNIQTDRNKNILLVGGPGSGKTRYNIKPNAMQLNSSFVITDPKGTLVPEIGRLFVGKYDEESDDWIIPPECMYTCTKDLYKYDRATGTSTLIAHKGDKVPYRVSVLNLINFNKSDHFNPLAYMKCEKDILKLVQVFMKNTDGEGAQKGEDFWVKAEQLFYNALFSYLFFECKPEERTIANVVEMLDMAKVKEDDEDYQSPLDMLFRELETGEVYNTETKQFEQLYDPQPNHFAVRQYHKYKAAAGKTAKSILISCAARLAPFDIDALRELMAYDELHLDEIGDYPTVLFVIVPDTDSTFNFLSAMCFYQMFNLLCDHADDDCGGKLNVPVQCLFDEFANTGTIPGMDKLMTTIRSRGMSAELVLQNLGQLDRDYDKAARIIKGSCDTLIYLGGGDLETCKEISEQMGNMTIAARNQTMNYGQSRSSSESDNISQRAVMDPSEVARLDRTKCIVQISGTYPFLADKYKLEDHPRYKYIDPGHKDAVYDNNLEYEQYLSWKRRTNCGKRKRPKNSKASQTNVGPKREKNTGTIPRIERMEKEGKVVRTDAAKSLLARKKQHNDSE